MTFAHFSMRPGVGAGSWKIEARRGLMSGHGGEWTSNPQRGAAALLELELLGGELPVVLELLFPVELELLGGLVPEELLELPALACRMAPALELLELALLAGLLVVAALLGGAVGGLGTLGGLLAAGGDGLRLPLDGCVGCDG